MPATNTVVTDFETYKAALVNVIPAQTAGQIAVDTGLANETGFCPIDPANMKSKMDPNIYVVGDACIPGDMPKSAFAANSQAKVAAMSIRGELAGARTFPARYTNTCWSLIEFGRLRESRRPLRAGRRQDQGDERLCIAAGGHTRGKKAEFRRVGRLVCRDYGGHLLLVHRSKRRLQPEFGKLMHKQTARALARERSECVSALAGPKQGCFVWPTDGLCGLWPMVRRNAARYVCVRRIGR